MIATRFRRVIVLLGELSWRIVSKWERRSLITEEERIDSARTAIYMALVMMIHVPMTLSTDGVLLKNKRSRIVE